MAKTKVNVSSGEYGEHDYGTLEINSDILNSKNQDDRLIVTTQDGAVTIEIGCGVVIHVFRSED